MCRSRKLVPVAEKAVSQRAAFTATSKSPGEIDESPLETGVSLQLNVRGCKKEMPARRAVACDYQVVGAILYFLLANQSFGMVRFVPSASSFRCKIAPQAANWIASPVLFL